MEVEGGVTTKDNECFMIASNFGQGTALMVVNDPAVIAPEDEKRRKRFQSWGWVVPYIDEADTQANFDTAVAEGVSLVEFFHPSCSHCRAMEPVVEQLATDLGL